MIASDVRTGINDSLGLVRRFAVDWLSGANSRVCDDIMTEDYTVDIGGITLDGRSSYQIATSGQLDQFPGLLITVHDVLNAGDRIAIRFTEHGPSIRHEGRCAAWRGMSLFSVRHGRLARCVAEEDYSARRRQLADGRPDPVDPPAVAPWATPRLPADPAAEQAVRDWLSAQAGFGEADVVLDDGRGNEHPVSDVESVEVTDLFSSGRQVAFRVLQTGRPTSVDSWSGPPVTLSSIGLVEVGVGGGIRGHVVRDTAGLSRVVRTSA